MDEKELLELLDGLLALDSENEVIEFKEANNDFDVNKIGKYFSALSNEANLSNKKNGWLIFGVKDKGHTIVGTEYRNNPGLHKLKEEIGNSTTNRISFQEIYEVTKDGKRVILFQIPSAPRGFPISWKGHYYARDHESLQPLNIEKIERIRSQQALDDFSMKICQGATLEDLDSDAIKMAREKFTQKHKDQIPSREIETWDDLTFLNKAKITIQGKITNTAIILLGKPQSEHFLAPAIAKISWILKNRDGLEIDYEHFSCPFLLSVDKVFHKIRNLKYRYLKEGTLFPEEVDKYEPYIIREGLNNCIAHQDYTLSGKINIVETEDELIFANLGNFIPGSVEKVLQSDSPSAYYRNTFLTNAMVNLKMIDTIGSGIKRMFIYQKNKLFPLPDYNLSDNKVSVTIIGKVLDINYAHKLIQNKDLGLEDILLLDKVQKQKNLSPGEVKKLRQKKLVEGRSPHIYISEEVASHTHQMSHYIKQRGFKDEHYKKMILDYLGKVKTASRKEIDDLLYEILPNILNNEQKKNKIRNILHSMSKNENTIINTGTNRNPIWALNFR